MAAKNEAATRKAAQQRLSFVMTAFRGVGSRAGAPAGCADPYAPVNAGVNVDQAMIGRRMLGDRRGAWMRWFFSGIWLVYLIAPVVDLFGKGHNPLFDRGRRAAGRRLLRDLHRLLCHLGAVPAARATPAWP